MKISIEQIRKERSIKELLEFSILNIDKPSGPTSFDVSDFVRKKMKEIGIRKTSHFGTLDPKVTGVLPVALNRACKLTGDFLGHDKVYIGVMRMHEEIDLEKIKNASEKNFTGKIKQTPPVRSRVARVEREREVKRFEIIEKDEKDFLFIAEVQGGTYIRKLIDDLGIFLEIGAHMLELRRIRAGLFSEEQKEFVNLYDFEKAVDAYKNGNENLLRKILIPAEIVSEIYPAFELKKEVLGRVLHGSPIMQGMIVDEKNLIKDGKISLFCRGKFVEIAKIVKEGKIIARPEFVLQPAGFV